MVFRFPADSSNKTEGEPYVFWKYHICINHTKQLTNSDNELGPVNLIIVAFGANKQEFFFTEWSTSEQPPEADVLIPMLQISKLRFERDKQPNHSGGHSGGK